ncbi:MAG TPA: YdcF family protein [Acidimicrobiales bacterium]|nr:YdcF family protein [Acidimicrobiales bacterium]
MAWPGASAPSGGPGRSGSTVLTGEHSAVGPPPDPGPPPPAPGARARRWRRRLVRVVALLLLLALSYLAVTFLQVWRASSRDDTARADAIVVLGAAQYDGRPSPVLEARLGHALDLYEQGLAPRIVVTGGRQDGDTFTEATSGYNWLRSRGVPDEAILKEVDGHNTFESLLAASRFLRARGHDEVLLVSDGYHALRVAGIAREVGLEPYVSTVNPDSSSIGALGRETFAVAVGRVIGYGRLTRITG